MALGMFCAVPLPFHIWDDDCMNLTLACFPVVGAVVGALWWGAAALLRLGAAHMMIASAAVAALPFLLTGFLHLDGYMDTSDAILSRRPLDEKLRILKDPHMGAFSAIMLAILFLLQFAAAYAVMDGGKSLAALAAVSVTARCCASAALLGLKAMPQSGYGNMLKRNTGKPHMIFVAACASAAIAFSYVTAGPGGVLAALFCAAGFAGAMAYAYKEFKGVSGDLTGFSLVIGELAGLLAYGVYTT